MKITMPKGAIVTVHVDDPQHLLTSAPGAIQSDLRFQFVTANGDRYDAVITAHNATSRDHSVTLPFGTAVTLQVMSPALAIHDATGRPAATTGTSVQVPATAASAAAFTFAVNDVGAIRERAYNLVELWIHWDGMIFSATASGSPEDIL